MTGFNPTIKKALTSFPAKRPRRPPRCAGFVTMLEFDPRDCVIKSVAAENNGAAQWAKVEAALRRLIIEGLRKLIVPDIALEKFFQNVRRYLLLELWPKGSLKTKDLTYICALAEQCFLNEYVYTAGEDEKTALSALPLDNPVAAAIAACYMPLHALAFPRNCPALRHGGNWRSSRFYSRSASGRSWKG